MRAVLAAAGLPPEGQTAAYDRLLDGDMTAVDEVEARLPQLNAPLRMLFEVDGQGSAYLTNLRAPLVSAVPALARPFDGLEFVVSALEARGVTPAIKAVLARSFEYYSGLVMRVESQGKRIAAGGRYDELIALVGGRSVPASGFALYVTPVAQLMAARTRPAGEIRVAVRPDTASANAVAASYAAAERLRAAGLAVETVEGMSSAPTHRLVCRDGSRPFTLERPGGSDAYDEIDAVVHALEASR